MFQGQSRRRIDRCEIRERFAAHVGLDVESFDAKNLVDGRSRRTASGSSPAARLLFDDLNFEFLRRPKCEFVEQIGGNERIVLGLDEPITHLAEPGFGALGEIKNAGETRHVLASGVTVDASSSNRRLDEWRGLRSMQVDS